MLAQTEGTSTGSISGIVRNATTGEPIANATVSVSAIGGSDAQRTTTDNEGAYTLSNVKPGERRVTAATPPQLAATFPATLSRMVDIQPGQKVTSLNFAIKLPGRISGRLVDQNDEPIAGADVILVAREYSLGALRYVYADAARTDDEGAYKINRVMPGRGYLVMATKRERKLGAIDEAPADPKLRRPAFAPTLYPGVTEIEGAQPLVLRAAELRENVDIRIRRTQSYCISGSAQGPNGPEVLRFSIRQRQPHSGHSGDGAMFMMEPTGLTDRDGKLRICGLAPGEYHLNVWPEASGFPGYYGAAEVQLLDRDVDKLTVVARPHVSVTGEVTWDGERPETPVESKLNVWLKPLTRANWMGEQSTHRLDVPGSFTWKDLMVDPYWADLPQGVPTGTYLKEFSYAGKNLLLEPFVPGSGTGEATLRIALGRDGGTIAANVADKDGNAVPDCRVLIMPVHADSEAALAAGIVSGQCNQSGAWRSRMIAPGKYAVLALPVPHNNSPEAIGKLWLLRSKATEVEVSPHGSAQVKLSPTSLD
jgi:hypothetical protein